MRRTWFWAVFLAFSVPVHAAPDKIRELTQSGAWEVNYDKHLCHLIGRFGTGDDQVILRLTRSGPFDRFDLALIGKPVLVRKAQVPVEIDFGLSNGPIRSDGLAGTIASLPSIYVINLRFDGWKPADRQGAPPSITPAQEASVRAIEVRVAGRRPFRLIVGSLGKPMAALRTCTGAVAPGGPAPGAGRISRPPQPIGGPASWIRDDDYPEGAKLSGANGLVQFRLRVTETGDVSECQLLARPDPDVFGDYTCQLLMKRAKFRPALDGQGHPVAVWYNSKVLWKH